MWRPWLARGGRRWEKGPGQTRNKLTKSCTGMSAHIPVRTGQVQLRDFFSYLYTAQTGLASCRCVSMYVCARVCLCICLCMFVCTHPALLCLCACVCPSTRVCFQGYLSSPSQEEGSSHPSSHAVTEEDVQINTRTHTLAHIRAQVEFLGKRVGGKRRPRTGRSSASQLEASRHCQTPQRCR